VFPDLTPECPLGGPTFGDRSFLIRQN
jgi:hypothetical protein